MKIIIQRVKEACVHVENEKYSQIGNGLVLLVGIETGDTEEDLRKASDKISKLRIFDDADGKMNESVFDVDGEILSVSQFTLAGKTKKGNRPSYSTAMSAKDANSYYEKFNQYLRDKGLVVKTGKFQTHMNVKLNNDGPVTIIMEVKGGKVL